MQRAFAYTVGRLELCAAYAHIEVVELLSLVLLLDENAVKSIHQAKRGNVNGWYRYLCEVDIKAYVIADSKSCFTVFQREESDIVCFEEIKNLIDKKEKLGGCVAIFTSFSLLLYNLNCLD